MAAWWDPNGSDVASGCVQLPGCLQLPWKRSRSPLLLLNLYWKEHWKDESKATISKGCFIVKFCYRDFGVWLWSKGALHMKAGSGHSPDHGCCTQGPSDKGRLHIWHQSRTPLAVRQSRADSLCPAIPKSHISHNYPALRKVRSSFLLFEKNQRESRKLSPILRLQIKTQWTP